MTLKESKDSLLTKAREEKRNYNWIEAAALYEKAGKLYLDENLIEKAKAYHKNEDHLKAKECYENASEILKKIPKYNFEGSYNAAWAMLEEAESLSKQEKREEAINQYRNTIRAFEETIPILKEALEKTTEQPEKERIEKLEKVAKEEDLIFKDIDLFQLRSERKKWEKEQKKERLFIQSTR